MLRPTSSFNSNFHQRSSGKPPAPLSAILQRILSVTSSSPPSWRSLRPDDSCSVGSESCGMVAAISLWRRPFRTGVPQRRDARRDWMEGRVPFGFDRVQDFALRFYCGLLQTISPETRNWIRLRALLLRSGRIDRNRGNPEWLGIARILQSQGRNGESVGKKPALRARLQIRDEFIAGELETRRSAHRTTVHHGFS